MHDSCGVELLQIVSETDGLMIIIYVSCLYSDGKRRVLCERINYESFCYSVIILFRCYSSEKKTFYCRSLRVSRLFLFLFQEVHKIYSKENLLPFGSVPAPIRKKLFSHSDRIGKTDTIWCEK